jgi:hypothetical protein
MSYLRISRRRKKRVMRSKQKRLKLNKRSRRKIKGGSYNIDSDDKIWQISADDVKGVLDMVRTFEHDTISLFLFNREKENLFIHTNIVGSGGGGIYMTKGEPVGNSYPLYKQILVHDTYHIYNPNNNAELINGSNMNEALTKVLNIIKNNTEWKQIIPPQILLKTTEPLYVEFEADGKPLVPDGKPLVPNENMIACNNAHGAKWNVCFNECACTDGDSVWDPDIKECETHV